MSISKNNECMLYRDGIFKTQQRLQDRLYLKRKERFVPVGGCWADCDEPTVPPRERRAEEERQTAVVWKSGWRMNFLQGRMNKKQPKCALFNKVFINLKSRGKQRLTIMQQLTTFFQCKTSLIPIIPQKAKAVDKNAHGKCTKTAVQVSEGTGSAIRGTHVQVGTEVLRQGGIALFTGRLPRV